MNRIVHVINQLDCYLGGPSNLVYGLCHSFEDNSYCIVTQNKPNINIPKSCLIKLLPSGLGKYGFFFKKNKKIVTFLNNSQGIILSGVWQFIILWALFNIKEGKNVYLFLHGHFDIHDLQKSYFKKRIYWFLVRKIFKKKIKYFLCTSSNEFRNMDKRLKDDIEQKVRIVPYGVLGFSGDNSYREDGEILFFGRITRKKGIEILFNYLEKYSCSLVHFAGPVDPIYKLRIQNLEKQGRLKYHGVISYEKREAFLKRFSVLILPSFQENFAQVVPEALSLGIPVLISEEVNISSIIKEANAGIVCPISEDIVGKLIQAWNNLNFEERRQMSHKARICFKSNFNIECLVKYFYNDIKDS